MAKRRIMGLFREPEAAASATDTLAKVGVLPTDMDVLTGAPYPEGAFGEKPVSHRLYYFPIVGAVCGFSVAMLVTIGTQLSYPLVTGGKPILGIPPMFIITYEGTMLGAILFTVLGIIFESRLPRPRLGLYDPRITEGYIGLEIACTEDELNRVEEALQKAGAADIVRERQGR